MAKFVNPPRLSEKERQNLMIYLCHALSSLKNPEEAAQFLTDLISPQETEMLAKRLKIAALLVEGKKYDEIRTELKVSHATIARVNVWLNLSGEGFRTVIRRTEPIEDKREDPQKLYGTFSWKNISRRYHWPNTILEEILEQSDKKHRRKILAVLDGMETKSRLLKDINKDLYEIYSKEKRPVRETPKEKYQTKKKEVGENFPQTTSY